MDYLNLSNSKEKVLIDKDVYPWLSNWKWRLGQNGYISRTSSDNGRFVLLRIHRVIMGDPKGFDIDHINGNKLDNRRQNLRIVSRAEGGFNRGMAKNNTSGIKGVRWVEKEKLWRAQIGFHNKTFIKSFRNKEDAIRQRSEWEVKYHGEFRRHL